MAIRVSIAYADMQGQYYQEIQVDDGATLHQAIVVSDLLKLSSLRHFSDWCLDNLTADPNHKAWYVGIYSVKKRLDTVLSDGDRIEIYRPLSHDPMARRKGRSGNG